MHLSTKYEVNRPTGLGGVRIRTEGQTYRGASAINTIDSDKISEQPTCNVILSHYGHYSTITVIVVRLRSS